MNCDVAREAMSSMSDGEPLPPGLTAGAVGEHLAVCGDCRDWAGGVERLSAMYRVEPAPPAPDMRLSLLDLFDRAGPHSGTAGAVFGLLRASLVLVAGVQLGVVVPALLFGHDREAPVHVAHEMGSFELAIAMGLLAVAYRPVWAAGMAWFTAAAAAALVVAAVGGLAGGATTIADEAPHFLVLVAAALLIALAGRQRPPSGSGVRRMRLVLPTRSGGHAGLRLDAAGTVRYSRRHRGYSQIPPEAWLRHRAA